MSLRLLEPPVKVERMPGRMGAGQVWSIAMTAVMATAVICEVYIVILMGFDRSTIRIESGYGV